jgi:hypothetical protein
MVHLTKEQIEEAYTLCKSSRKAAKYCKVSYATFQRIAKEAGLWRTNQSGKGLVKAKKPYLSPEDVFEKGKHITGGVLKRVLLLERKWECEECKISEWRGNTLPLEIDHIDGDTSNNLRDNLKILCPNCHAQTPTWRSSNKGNAYKNISDEDFLEALESTDSIRQALIKLGMAPKGGNYSRAYQLLSKQ